MVNNMKEDLQLLSLLRKDARETLTNLSKQIQVPISTLYDRLRSAKHSGLIKRFTVLPDYETIGFSARAFLLIRTSTEARAKVKAFMSSHPHINCLYRINNGYDFMLECIFPTIREMEDFLTHIEQEFRFKSLQVFYLLEEVMEEAFLTQPLGVHNSEV